jgi:hypothetical protein
MVLEFVLPNPENPVTSSSQLPGDFVSSDYIGLDLPSPIACVAFGERTEAVRAMVPEATVNKYDEPFLGKQEIRPALDDRMKHPPRKRITNKAIPQFALGGTVAASPYLTHEFAALFAAENIHARPHVVQFMVLKYHSSRKYARPLVFLGRVGCPA